MEVGSIDFDWMVEVETSEKGKMETSTEKAEVTNNSQVKVKGIYLYCNFCLVGGMGGMKK